MASAHSCRRSGGTGLGRVQIPLVGRRVAWRGGVGWGRRRRRSHRRIRVYRVPLCYPSHTRSRRETHTHRGIMFQDITTLLLDHKAFKDTPWIFSLIATKTWASLLLLGWKLEDSCLFRPLP